MAVFIELPFMSLETFIFKPKAKVENIKMIDFEE